MANIELFNCVCETVGSSEFDWYKEIKWYWVRELEWIKALYSTVKEENLYRLQEKDKLATAFITFLNNLEGTKKISEMAKV